MISAGFMSTEELLVKLKTWKSKVKKMGLHVNMWKTKIMVSGLDLGFFRNLEKIPAVSVRKEYVAMQYPVVAVCAGYTRNAMESRAPYALTLISGAPGVWVQHDLLMEEQ